MALGTTFLRQYTAAFNLNDRAISLAPSITSEPGSAITPIGPSPGPDPDGSHLSVLEIFAIAAGSFLLLVIIIACCVYFITKDNRDYQ